MQSEQKNNMEKWTGFYQRPMENGMDRPDSMSPPNSGSKRPAMKGNRPSIQIYRPPGMRSGHSTTNIADQHSYTMQQKQQTTNVSFPTDRNLYNSQPQSGSYYNNSRKENSFDSNFPSESQSKPTQTAGSKQSQYNKRRNSEKLRPRSPTKPLDPRPRSPTKQVDSRPKSPVKQPENRPRSPTKKLDSRPRSPTKQVDTGRQHSKAETNGKEEEIKQTSPPSRNRKSSPGPATKTGSGAGGRGKNPGPPSPGPQRRRGPSPGPEGGVPGDGNHRRAPSPGLRLPGRQNSFVKERKKVSLSPGDVEEMKELLGKLDLRDDAGMMEKFIRSGFDSEDLGPPVAQALVQSAIEEGKGSKVVSKLCSLVMEASSGDSFHQGLVTASWEYYDCRQKLRSEHFKYWLAFINFVSDLYAAVGFTYEGELVEILFRIFEFMLGSPVLENLKIEELECLISALLSVGYDLERQCPDQLSRLRDSIRDAFIHAQEPWARKMILLLVELSASGWKLPAESNEYYFQAAASSL